MSISVASLVSGYQINLVICHAGHSVTCSFQQFDSICWKFRFNSSRTSKFRMTSFVSAELASKSRNDSMLLSAGRANRGRKLKEQADLMSSVNAVAQGACTAACKLPSYSAYWQSGVLASNSSRSSRASPQTAPTIGKPSRSVGSRTSPWRTT